jgi:hypothetical protein
LPSYFFLKNFSSLWCHRLLSSNKKKRKKEEEGEGNGNVAFFFFLLQQNKEKKGMAAAVPFCLPKKTRKEGDNSFAPVTFFFFVFLLQ